VLLQERRDSRSGDGEPHACIAATALEM